MVRFPRALGAAAFLAAATVVLAACGAVGATGAGDGSGGGSGGGSGVSSGGGHQDGSGGSFKAARCPAQPKTIWAKPATGAHTVPTAMGDVRVPAAPKRVVVLDTAELDSALTLGVRPVGATHADAASGFLAYLPKDEVAGIKDVGTIGAPDMEAVAALKPDLILTSKVRDGQRYAQLKKIAPTVMTETTGYPWKQNFATHADALGKIPEGRKAAAAYEKHAAAVTDALGGPAAAAKKTTNVVRFVEGADTRVYGCRSYIGTVLDDIGTAPTDVVRNAPDGLMTEVGPEQITRADADAVFYSAYGSPEKSKESQVTGGPLWKTMKAVRTRHAFRVSDQLWLQGIGYTAADKILTELKRDLTK
ncbi:iron-siderophore ABC transporter substrate-binding protein [Streptomyces sp. Ru73]|uniref:ABC transporter substrate-binding protein n=1 Tax=Streptomyces sp. Ru73 TaxID=2080748 RepID=UPI000CDDD958|nr:iron-siderophore ABC transporter substrate-binding protein [Streptomyces sp. Ru73]